ncbi:MAG: type II toxin-antitoxin system VapC family toxin [Fimbriimonas sp.]
MVIDTSAVVAILLREPTRADLLAKVVTNTTSIAAPSVLETYMVMRRHLGASTESTILAELERWRITIVDFTPEHAIEATRAFDQFGKGRHPAGLNFGDCIAYALAKVSHQTLLFVGDDFRLTDIRPAL